MKRFFVILLCVMLGASFASAADKPSIELLKAAEAGDNRAIETLLAEGVQIDSRDRRGFTPLMYAAANDRVETINLLIVRGAEVNARSDIGETALICAVRYGRGRPETVKALLDAGADPTIVMEDGGTALSWASRKKRTEAVALLSKPGSR